MTDYRSEVGKAQLRRKLDYPMLGCKETFKDITVGHWSQCEAAPTGNLGQYEQYNK